MSDANALTLSEYAVMSNDPLVMKITSSLLFFGIVLGDIPLVNKKTLVANGVRWENNLPVPTWSRINTAPTVTKGKPTVYQEQAYLLRNALDTDIVLVEEENRIVDPRVAQIQAYLAAVTYDYNDKFINNDHLSGDAQAPVGLRYRIDNGSVYGVHSDMKINAGAVDLSAGGMTQATANSFIEYIEQALDVLGSTEGDNVHMYMNENMRRKFGRAIRVLGPGAGFNTIEDAFGRRVTAFRNAMIHVIGRKADQTTQIITSTETAAGAAGADVHTSIYFTKYGEEQFMGWQYAPLGESIKDIGLYGNDGTIVRALSNWVHGLFPQSTRCLARIYGVKVA